MWTNREAFVQKEIQILHPLSIDYQDYWREEIRRLIEGYWVGGIWCPPTLYHYLNHATIDLTPEKNSKTQVKGRPFNLDYVWELAYYWAEARGLSGFEKIGDVEDIRYLLRHTTEDLGKPLYNNPAKNLLYMTARGSGKSFWGANVVAHEFITDGRKEYIPGEKIKHTAEILISAYDTKYVNDVCSKIKTIFDNYKGGMEINGIYYPSPINKQLSGSWMPGKKVEHYYKKKVGGKWMWAGTRSNIKPRTYKDNPFAAQGGRNSIKVGEEIGVWDNLIESHFADEFTQRVGNNKFGSTLYQGTGGDMVGGGTLASQKMMYDPEAYDCLVFNDEWEGRGKICLFFPATLTKFDYKDDKGNTDLVVAQQGEEEQREKKKGAKNSQAYDEYVVYNPLVPSEIFLSRNNNKFPLKDLQYTLAVIETDKRLRSAESIGDLHVNELREIFFKENKDNRPLYDFPLKGSDPTDGSIVIYEHPQIGEEGFVPFGRYIAGLDPYAQKEATTDSLGSMIVLDRLTNRIVAEYSARPDVHKDFYENCRRLAVYYNCKVLYENNIQGTFDYFESKQSLHLLAPQPRLIRDIIPNSKVDRGYGMHMSPELKSYGEDLINQWLRDINDGELKNVHKIRCIPLLKELIMYNPDGNFDRVMALMVCLYQLNEMRTHPADEQRNYVPMHQRGFFNKKKFNQPIIN